MDRLNYVNALNYLKQLRF